MRRSVPQIYPHIVRLILVLMAFAAAQGQSPRSNPSDLRQREWELSHIPDQVNSHFNREDKASPPQIRADFRRLQIVNNDLMKRFFVLHSTDARTIKSALGEIHKLAGRLHTCLTLSAPVPREASVAEKPQFGPGLLQLDRAVMSFVNNPVFQEAKVMDATLARQAGDDLNEIVRLSELLGGLNVKEAARK
jgi:hypothetical protein